MLIYTCKRSGEQYKQVDFWDEPNLERPGTYTVQVLENLATGKQVGVARNIVLREYTASHA